MFALLTEAVDSLSLKSDHDQDFGGTRSGISSYNGFSLSRNCTKLLLVQGVHTCTCYRIVTLNICL
jgi:hypothetical protein